MTTIIRSQTAILVAMLAAFALTLSACGGGSSSSSAGGGASFNSATVTGTVTNGGVASLELRNSSGLLIALSDMFVPVARADEVAFIPVTFNCGGTIYETETDANGHFSIVIADYDGLCSTQFGEQAGPDINVASGMTTTLQVVLDDGNVQIVSENMGPSAGGTSEIAGDLTSSDDDSIASSDDDSDSVDSVDDDSVASADDDSVSGDDS